MSLELTLRHTVAEIFQKEPPEIGSDFPLKGRRFEGSVGRGILDAAIRRRLGVTCPEVYSVKTYGELEAAVLGVEIGQVTDRPPENASSLLKAIKEVEGGASGLSCGVDIEMVENLPLENDYWEADFYKMLFSKDEIAYCVAQEDPRVHFAARWCAKEALKKCNSTYLELDMARIVVIVDEAGKPSLQIRIGQERHELPVAVSLTHTPVLAAAIVVGPGA